MNSITYEPTTESPPDILKAAIDLQKTIVNNGGSIRVRVLPETLALTLIEEFSKSSNWLILFNASKLAIKLTY